MSKVNRYEIKVCGITHQSAEIDRLEVDYIGHIFWPKSLRYAKAALTNELSSLSNAKRIGVFVNASLKEIKQSVHEFKLDGVQLHGTEPASFLAELKISIPELILFKAVAVDNHTPLDELAHFEGLADRLVFDTKGALPGGNGFHFDWNQLEQYQSSVPFLLSGGIGPEDLSAISTFIQTVNHPQFSGVDLNSRFELGPGIKDIQKLANFVEAFYTL